MNPQVDVNDRKVVAFHNSESFGFTPEMGCMYDGRPVNGATGAPGIDAGETVHLPYHIAHRLATNLAKYSMIRKAPVSDGVNTGGPVKPLWNVDELESVKKSYLTDLYVQDKPATESETDKLFRQVEELKKFVADQFGKEASVQAAVPTPAAPSETVGVPSPVAASSYKDKADVIAELQKRGITFNVRDSKAKLEKLLIS